MKPTPAIFQAGYEILLNDHAGHPIGMSPFKRSINDHWMLRDHMSQQDWQWAERYLNEYDKAGWRKWEDYRNSEMEKLLRNVENCDDDTFNTRFEEHLRSLVANTSHYDNKQKQATEHYKQLWGLYSKTTETIYKRKHNPDHPHYITPVNDLFS